MPNGRPGEVQYCIHATRRLIMALDHAFGGDWTEEKLTCLAKYLAAYRQIFTKNAKARHFRTWYVDAFAGTGSRVDPQVQSSSEGFFADVYEETTEYRDGSVRRALSLASPFDHYLFIEDSKARVAELKEMVASDFAPLLPRCEIERGDANDVLKDWCGLRDWKHERAVVFLDPYGMQVEWATIEALAATKAVDLWYLFPLGIGVSRLMPKDGIFPAGWRARLDKTFGTDQWYDRFYKTNVTQGFFFDEETVQRDASVEKISSFIHERLQKTFFKAAEGKLLRNTKMNPLYLFCFAASNEKGAPIACRIASSILK